MNKPALSRGLLFACNRNLLAIQSPAIVLLALSSTWQSLTRGLLFACNRNLLALQSPAIVLRALSSTWQSLNVTYASVALDFFQSPNGKCIESPKVSFNHVLGNFITKSNKLLFRQIFGDFVLHFKVIQDLKCPGTPYSMYIL